MIMSCNIFHEYAINDYLLLLWQLSDLLCNLMMYYTINRIIVHLTKLLGIYLNYYAIK